MLDSYLFDRKLNRTLQTGAKRYNKAIFRMSTDCAPCRKTFYSENALQQHLRDSPAHRIECRDCEKSFDSENALQQHLRDSPVRKSRSQVYKSYGGFHNFIQSHGLKRKKRSSMNALFVHSLSSYAAYNLEDLEEAGMIADMMSQKMRGLSV